METLYNACDSLFSACQEGGAGCCGTTMAGTLPQSNALIHPPFTAPGGKLVGGDVNLFVCLGPWSTALNKAETRL